MSEIVKSEYNALGEDNNYKTHYFKTSADQVVGLGRLKNTEYQVDDVVYSDTNNKVALKCITAGTTSNTELDISGKAVGKSVDDGSVVWKVIARSNVLDENGVVPITEGGTGNTTGKAQSAIKLATARIIDGVSFDGTTDIVHYGVCETAAETAAKTVSVTDFKLVTGAVVRVKFTKANTASSPTLNVNSTGAKSIMYRGYAPATLTTYNVYEFVYDGTYWRVVGNEMVMIGATASGAGKAGLVPAPASGKQNTFLRGDGTWVNPNTNATSIGDASTTKPAVVVTTYQNGTSWYRKWSDGWVEQGGKITTTGTVTVTLPVKMSSAEYHVALGYEYGTTLDARPVDTKNRTASGFQVPMGNSSNLYVYWTVSGKAV